MSAVVVQKEFVELFDCFQADFDAAPKVIGGEGWLPFLEVENSHWRAALPEYQRGDRDALKHYRIGSMETHLDLFGFLESTEWVEQGAG